MSKSVINDVAMLGEIAANRGWQKVDSGWVLCERCDKSVGAKWVWFRVVNGETQERCIWCVLDEIIRGEEI